MALLPDEFVMQDAVITNGVNILESDTRGLDLLQRKIPGQRWEFQIESILLEPDDADVAYAFLVARQQDTAVMQLKFPRYSFSTITAKTTSGAATTGDTSIDFVSVTDVTVGKYFQFANHTKVYMVTGVSGATVSFAPNLTNDVPDATSVAFNDIEFNLRVRGRPQRFEVAGDTDYIRLQFNAVEIK